MKPKTKSNKTGPEKDTTLKAETDPRPDTGVNKQSERKDQTKGEVTNQNGAITNGEDFGQFDPTTFLM